MKSYTSILAADQFQLSIILSELIQNVMPKLNRNILASEIDAEILNTKNDINILKAKKIDVFNEQKSFR